MANIKQEVFINASKYRLLVSHSCFGGFVPADYCKRHLLQG